MKLITPGEVSSADRYATEVLKLNIIQLIESAAEELFKRCIGYSRVTVLCGGGNNGADGLCAAKKLFDYGVSVNIWIICRDGEAGVNVNCKHFLEKISAVGIEVNELNLSAEPAQRDFSKLINDISSSEAILECILGTGYIPKKRKESDSLLHRVFRIINDNAEYVISADMAAGVNGENGEVEEIAVKANETITFSYIKPGNVIIPGKEYCGKVIASRISIPDEAYHVSMSPGHELLSSCDIDEVCDLIPKRDPFGHKGSFGKVLVIAGSEGMTGAAVLAAGACLKSGAGLCYLASPRGLLDIYEIKTSEIVKIPLGSKDDKWFDVKFAETLGDFSKDMDAVLIGPGLGCRPETFEFVKQFLSLCVCNNIIADADCLKSISTDPTFIKGIFENKNVVITPHRGEMSVLLNGNAEAAKRLSACKVCKDMYGATVVYKGNDTITYKDSNTYTVNNTGNCGMATAGSGDVLSGIIAAFLAAGLSVYDAARVGVFLHGLAGDIAKEKYTVYGMTAGDILENIPQAFKMILKSINK